MFITLYTDAIQQGFTNLASLLQEDLQRRNNANDGSALCHVSDGSTLLAFADPSAIGRDTISLFGVASGRKREFSKLLGAATHDSRQYTPETTCSKKSKYDKNLRRME